MNNLKNLKFCIKPTGFEYLCPHCNSSSVHLLPIPGPRYIREGSIAEYHEPKMQCMRCYKIISTGEKILLNPIEVKKVRKEIYITIIITIISLSLLTFLFWP